VTKSGILNLSIIVSQKPQIDGIMTNLTRRNMVLDRDMDAKSVMVSEPYYIHSRASVLAALAQMHRLGIGHFPVVENEIVIGLVSETMLLPFSSPPDCPPEISQHRFLAAEDKKVGDVMIPVDNLSLIYEHEDQSTFIDKFFRDSSPARNLLIVVKSPMQRDLRGVISWVNLFQHWDGLSMGLFDKLTCQEVAVPLSQIPSLQNKKHYTVGSALARADNTRHRHIQIIKDDSLVALYHFHELVPYRPIDLHDIIQVDYYEERDFLEDLTPKISIEARAIPASAPITDAIEKYLESVKKPRNWQDRLAGLLVKQSDDTFTHLLTPYDIIDKLRQSSDVSHFVVPYHLDSGKKSVDERLRIGLVRENGKFRLYTPSDRLPVSDNPISIEQNIFFEDPTSSLVLFKDVKGKLSEQEVTVLNLFLDTMR